MQDSVSSGSRSVPTRVSSYSFDKLASGFGRSRNRSRGLFMDRVYNLALDPRIS